MKMKSNILDLLYKEAVFKIEMRKGNTIIEITERYGRYCSVELNKKQFQQLIDELTEIKETMRMVKGG